MSEDKKSITIEIIKELWTKTYNTSISLSCRAKDIID